MYHISTLAILNDYEVVSVFEEFFSFSGEKKLQISLSISLVLLSFLC